MLELGVQRNRNGADFSYSEEGDGKLDAVGE